MAQQQRPRMNVTGTSLDAPDASKLATFYSDLLGWQVAVDEGDWVKLAAPDGGRTLAFQTEPLFARPTWPSREGEQQMQLHLEIEVDDLAEAGAHAEAVGATLADFQPQDDVRVYLDPAGHPFCLYL